MFLEVLCLRPTIMESENKTRFQQFCRFFLPGTLKNIPCSLNELVSFVEELGGFAGSSSNGWPTGPVSVKKIEAGGIGRNRRPESYNSPSFDQKLENGPTGHPLKLGACKVGLSH